MSVSKNQSIGLILAGGKGSRMGFKDKPFLRIGGRTIAQWILSQSEKHIDEFLFSLKRNHIKYHQFGHKIVCDISGLSTGPLIGIYSAMEFLYQKSGQNESTYILTFPGDVPFFPETLIPTLMHRLEKSPLDVVVARSEQHLQPLFAAWALSAREKVKKYINKGFVGPRQILPHLNHQVVFFETKSELEFLNINTEQDLKTAQYLTTNPLKN